MSDELKKKTEDAKRALDEIVQQKKEDPDKYRGPANLLPQRIQASSGENDCIQGTTDG